MELGTPRDFTTLRGSSLIDDSELFLSKLREFKPQSLGCLEARRKSSSTLIFPSPPQACLGPPNKCPNYPHGVKPTPGYWIECHGPGPDPFKSGIEQKCQSSTASKATTRNEEINRLNIHNNVHSHRPTTPTADLILTRYDRGILFDIDDEFDTTANSLYNRNDFNEFNIKSSSSSQDKRINERASNTKQTSIKQQGSYDDGQGGAILKTTRGSVMTSSMKKRRNKRTMTRDDIDLHKPRRGTPNITITEPSFNQSTASYLPSISRQERVSPNLGRMDSIESAASVEISLNDFANIDDDANTCNNNHHMKTAKSTSTSNNDNDKFNIPESKVAHKEGPFRGTASPDLIIDFSDNSTPNQSPAPEILRNFSSATPSPSLGMAQSSRNTSASGYAVDHKTYSANNYQYNSDTTERSQNVTQTKEDIMLELISFEEENYEKHYYGREHWNYFTNDEMLGPVMLSLKQEVNNQRDHFHVLLRTVSYTLHGTIPASTICADRYDREAIVRELSEIAKLKPPLMLGQLPSTPDELLKLDHMFIKSELKVGVIYIKEKQANSEEAILGNKEESPLFTEFLDILGDRIKLKGFDRYKGGLDTVHNLTGFESIYTLWRNIEIMFHVSTMLPHEENDPQKLQKKRHIGNDIVCVAFIESDDLFWPGCIKSYFLHTFIIVRTSPKPLLPDEKRKYIVSCVCRNEVQHAFKPYLNEQHQFEKSEFFREWLMVKIVNGERASYSAPKFARMQDRTRSQMLEDIIANLANHLVTGQIPKPYRRGSWRPLGHTRASSPLEDSMKDYFEDYDQLAKDFHVAFCGPSRDICCNVVFNVWEKQGKNSLENKIRQVYGVRAILAIRSRTFLEMLYGFVPPGSATSSLQNQMNSLRAIEMKALGGETLTTGKDQPSKTSLAKRGSVGLDLHKRSGEKERRQSMIPSLTKSMAQKPNYLTVPSTSGAGVIKQAFNRLVSGNWSGWGGNIKQSKNDFMHIKVDQNHAKVDLTNIALCKEIAKIDHERLAQKEFNIIEFDAEVFQQTIEYIHNGQCKLSYDTIPGLICAAEHYDLPDLLHACFHHANTHMRLSAAPKMLSELENYTWRYITAMQLLNSIMNYIDPLADELFSRQEYLQLSESMLMSILTRQTLQLSETRRFQVMVRWARHHVNSNLPLDVAQEINKSSEFSMETLRESMVESEFRRVMMRLVKEIKLEKISNEDIVKFVLPAKVIDNKVLFKLLSDESREESQLQ